MTVEGNLLPWSLAVLLGLHSLVATRTRRPSKDNAWSRCFAFRSGLLAELDASRRSGARRLVVPIAERLLLIHVGSATAGPAQIQHHANQVEERVLYGIQALMHGGLRSIGLNTQEVVPAFPLP